jgi:acetyl-CoA C-acetyltransferase
MFTFVRFAVRHQKISPSTLSTAKFSTSSGLNEVVIVSTARTPVGSFQGKLSSLTAPKLGSIAVKEAIHRAGIKPDQVGEVILGNVLSAGMGQAPARQVSLGAGIPESVPCTTINKVCSSGMKSIMFAAQSIMLGHQDIIVAGGFESMSNVPFYLDKARNGYRYGHGQLLDGVLKDGLTDVYSDIHMGMCGEETAKKLGFSRDDQDQYAILSYNRAKQATEKGLFKREIVKVSIPQKKGDPIVVDEDEEYKNMQTDKIAGLKPAFIPTGTITAANASKINDGACAVVLMSAAKAQQLKLTPLAKIRGFGDAEQAPIDFPTAPALAVPKALKNAGVNQNEIDYWEINEAFSVVALANAKLLKLDLERLNVYGGGVSLGHPIGASGARLVATLISVLQDKKAKLGCAAICNGGGGASSIVIEKL